MCCLRKGCHVLHRDQLIFPTRLKMCSHGLVELCVRGVVSRKGAPRSWGHGGAVLLHELAQRGCLRAPEGTRVCKRAGGKLHIHLLASDIALC